MPVPKYNELYIPLLRAIEDGKAHSVQELRATIASDLQLTQEDLQEVLPSGKQAVFVNRLGWAQTYLKKAGLVETPKRAYVQITAEGTRVLRSGVVITDEYLRKTYPDFAAFKQPSATGEILPTGSSSGKQPSKLPLYSEPDETPQETLERVFTAVNAQLAGDLLEEILHQSPTFFEKLVVDLMRAMGYGDGDVTPMTGDDGIDGVINEDKLGFSLIYVQAKRWDPKTSIGRPEIQKFAGAMMGPPKIEKGLFITTAKFTQGARDYADNQHIILIDGRRLAELMIEYDLGVTTQQTYRIKRIDTDYFAE